MDLEVKEITIRIPVQLNEKLERYAEIKGLSKKDIIIFILDHCFQQTAQE